MDARLLSSLLRRDMRTNPSEGCRVNQFHPFRDQISAIHCGYVPGWLGGPPVMASGSISCGNSSGGMFPCEFTAIAGYPLNGSPGYVMHATLVSKPRLNFVRS